MPDPSAPINFKPIPKGSSLFDQLPELKTGIKVSTEPEPTAIEVDGSKITIVKAPRVDPAHLCARCANCWTYIRHRDPGPVQTGRIHAEWVSACTAHDSEITELQEETIYRCNRFKPTWLGKLKAAGVLVSLLPISYIVYLIVGLVRHG